MINLEKLTKITETYTTLYKEAATSTVKDALAIADSTTKMGGRAIDYASKVFIAPTALSVPVGAAVIGALASKLSSPEVLAKNADKYVLRAALDAEIAVMKRRIADELAQQNKVKNKKYDRFV